MTFAVIKLSYNKIGESNVEGGICGAGFFIDNKTFVTANHIFNAIKNMPNPGCTNCQYCLISRNGEIIEVINATILEYPGIDTTVIKFHSKVTEDIVRIDRSLPKIGDKICNQGFISNMPQINAEWGLKGLIIKSANLNSSISDASGIVRESKKDTVNANDVKILNKTIIVTSYPGNVGMSGGPMFNEKNLVVGLMSIGLPPDVTQKDFLGAIWIDEILKTV